MADVAVLPACKRCPKCEETKFLTEFHVRKSGPGKGYAVDCCKLCAKQRRASLKQRDPTIYRRIEWPSKLKRYYGITVDDYYRMLAQQGGGCGICGKSVPCVRRHKNRETEMFFVDHCHSTGVVRGLLCNACNRALGYFEDNAERLEKAAEYLRRSRL